MVAKNTIHPDSVFQAIFSTNSHPIKRSNLELIHKVCSERYAAGGRDFSIKSIGDDVEARGGLKVKALWNPQSADYRILINAWREFGGVALKTREPPRYPAGVDLAPTIDDPATKILVERLIVERNALRAEVNILKAQSSLTIDRRPKAAAKVLHVGEESGMTVEIPSKPPLINQIEREALEHAVSLSLWKDEGWVEEPTGRIVKPFPGGLGRTIFKPGFATFIRRILAGTSE